MSMSSGGGGGPSELRKILRANIMRTEEFSEDRESEDRESERVPSSLARIVPFLRAANEIQEENPRVAYLCRFTAFEKAHMIDPNSSGRGVRQFKTYLLDRLDKDEKETKRRPARTDKNEIKRFYEEYCRKYLEKDHQTRKQDKMDRYYQNASVLHDVLKTLIPETPNFEYEQYAKGFEKEKPSFPYYNILPLNISGSTQPVMEIPEIKAAVDLLRRMDNLPTARPNKTIVRDLLDWLGQIFRFQKGNVQNQKEHLILLLANMDMRGSGIVHQSEGQSYVINRNTVDHLMKKVFHNYISWCQYLHLESNIKIPHDASTQQLQLLYIGLYLLIWGEASNVRFMPECLCYIFHHMARDLHNIISSRREASFESLFHREGNDDGFLQLVIQPIYNVLQNEAALIKHGAVSHSKWRNYDDLNEYFWSKKCFKQLGWPMDPASEFFTNHTETINNIEQHDNSISRWRMSKTNFVEVRTFLHLFRSFDRMWTFFILAFQAMVIIAWSPSGSLSAIFEPAVFRNVMTIFITAAFVNFLQATLEIVLNWKAWRSLEQSQMIRHVLKFVVAIGWLITLPLTYSSSIQNSTGLIKFFSNWTGNFQSQSIYNYVVALYMLPNIFSALFFIFRPIRRALERSNYPIITFLLWWAQPKLYVARGMHEDTCSLLKYTTFWILLLICKLAFSYYVEISPLVGPTRAIMFLGRKKYIWHEFFPCLHHNLGVVITIWAPIVMVYFIDTQIWYAIFSTIYGGVNGAFSHLGEIRTLGMLRSRFDAVPTAFGKLLLPTHGGQPNRQEHENEKTLHIDKFFDIWNAFIMSLRDEDLISNRERDLLIVPSFVRDTSIFQWPSFLLASKIPIALDMARSIKKSDEELRKRINQDPYTYYAVIECYETFLNIIYNLIAETSDRKFVDRIRESLEDGLHRQSLLEEFRFDELPQLIAKFDKLLILLLKFEQEEQDTTIKTQIANLLQDMMEIITRDIMKNGQGVLKDENKENQLFTNLNLDSIKDEAWREKCVRIRLLLTTEESKIYVPTNLEARRRITFFVNSLFMKMPRAPQVRSMMSFSVLTSYFKEEVLFTREDLYKKNEDGISILFYLKEIYPDEWKNCLERLKFEPKDEESLGSIMDEISTWASYRGQTLSRTVRGMMYYRRALEIQCIQDRIDTAKLDCQRATSSYQEGGSVVDMALAITDIKFTYVVSCQVYGMQKVSKDIRDKSCYLSILKLMIMYPSLRIAYIDEVEALTETGTIEKIYYSVLVKAVGKKYDEEIYRIKLPGKPTNIGEGKPENQNHAIIFTRGEALQAIDMNQDNYLEEAFKMRNVLEEFENNKYGNSKPTILGLREHICTPSVSSLAQFMSNQETSVVTIGQRVLANPLKVPWLCRVYFLRCSTKCVVCRVPFICRVFYFPARHCGFYAKQSSTP